MHHNIGPMWPFPCRMARKDMANHRRIIPCFPQSSFFGGLSLGNIEKVSYVHAHWHHISRCVLVHYQWSTPLLWVDSALKHSVPEVRMNQWLVGKGPLNTGYFRQRGNGKGHTLPILNWAWGRVRHLQWSSPGHPPPYLSFQREKGIGSMTHSGKNSHEIENGSKYRLIVRYPPPQLIAINRSRPPID